jgi:hypothetical protein
VYCGKIRKIVQIKDLLRERGLVVSRFGVSLARSVLGGAFVEFRHVFCEIVSPQALLLQQLFAHYAREHRFAFDFQHGGNFEKI